MVSVGGGIAIAISVLLVVAVVGWIAFTQLRARKLGLPPPTFSSYLPWKKTDSYREPRASSGGVKGWFGKISGRNQRSAAGAYEQSGQRGFGALDPDEAWDSRVGNEADGYGYYEERELDGRDGPYGNTEYSGAGDYRSYPETTAHLDAAEERGRKTTRTPGGAGGNPFDDDAGSGLRDVSPRPMGGAAGGAAAAPVRNSLEGRRSAFREDV